VSKSTVSRICKDLDEQVEACRSRPLDHTSFAYVFCDAERSTRQTARDEDGRRRDEGRSRGMAM
jgi:transposase-like protein